MPAPSPSVEISYEQFIESWVDALRRSIADQNGEAETDSSDKTALRREFVRCLLADWVGAEHDLHDDDFVYLGDGALNGIDAFYIEETSPADEESETEATRTARVVRFLLPAEIPATGRAVLQETAKIRHTLDSAPLAGPLAPLLDLWRAGGRQNALEVVFASANPLPSGENDAVAGAEAILSAAAPLTARGAVAVSAQAVSLHSIYAREHIDRSIQVPLAVRAPQNEAQTGLVIGAVSLLDLYEFLKQFRAQRGDLDPLYEKNVRVFLGRTGKINKGISATLRLEPQNFGLYNNGLTLVTRELAPQDDGSFLLTDPLVVNGCQTTRTIWETLSEQLRLPPETDAEKRQAWQTWRDKLDAGRVVVKIVRVAPGEVEDDDLRLENITRYTNSQNAVKDKDFIALDRDFRRWKRELAMQSIFLEILRNEGTAQIARQKPKTYAGTRYVQVAKAFELFKVYGAGWMNEPGPAWNQNSAFVPKGAIFKSITGDDTFGGGDFMAALHLQNAADKQRFGKSGNHAPAARSKTKFLFYRTAIELLRRLLKRLDLPAERADCTRALLALQNCANEWRVFIDYATDAIDDYMNAESDYPIFKEPSYDGDFNAFFKKTLLAKSQNGYPQLWSVWNMTERLIHRDAGFMARVEPVLRTAFQTSAA